MSKYHRLSSTRVIILLSIDLHCISSDFCNTCRKKNILGVALVEVKTVVSIAAFNFNEESINCFE
jgi:hypothetical protein